MNSDDILRELLEKALELDADALAIEYKSGKDEVCAMKGGFGFEIACFDSSGKESQTLREKLYAMAGKNNTIKLSNSSYRLKTMVFDSFHEDAFVVEIKKLTEDKI